MLAINIIESEFPIFFFQTEVLYLFIRFNSFLLYYYCYTVLYSSNEFIESLHLFYAVDKDFRDYY